MYLIPAATTKELSTVKFANFLAQQTSLCLVFTLHNEAGLDKQQLTAKVDNPATESLSCNWYAEKNISDGEEVSDSKNISPLHTIIVAAAGLNFEMLEEIIVALQIQSNSVNVVANAYNCAFDKMVVNIDCHIEDADIMTGELNRRLKLLSEALFIDVFLKPNISFENQGLAVFDMDSTLIEMECIDEIAKLAGVGDAVSKVTELAMLGEIAFAESLHHRVACLNGVNLSALLSIRRRLPFMPGFVTLINELKRKGWKVAIASGGFTYFADYIKVLFELDYAFSNTLEVKDNKLTGKVVGKVIDAQAKADVLQKLAKENNIPMANTIAVGDGANDLIMMSVAGSGVAFKAKPKVQAQAANSIRFSGLEAVLYLLG
nr:phosphoserine phosphatase SerB [uncultured Glaciecola sp.]